MSNDQARRKIPEHEREAVTDSELRTADQITDAEFRERIAMPELIGAGPRMPRGKTGYTIGEER